MYGNVQLPGISQHEQKIIATLVNVVGTLSSVCSCEKTLTHELTEVPCIHVGLLHSLGNLIGCLKPDIAFDAPNRQLLYYYCKTKALLDTEVVLAGLFNWRLM